MVNHLNILISINFKNLIPMLQVQGQRDQLVRSVESLDTWQLIVIIGWIMPIKSSIHLLNLLQWPLHPMLVLLRSSLGQLIVLLWIMSHPTSTISIFQSLPMVKITLLLAMAKIYLLLIQVIPLFPPLILPCILIVFLEFIYCIKSFLCP